LKSGATTIVARTRSPQRVIAIAMNTDASGRVKQSSVVIRRL
jgi:hypothetical protein